MISDEVLAREWGVRFCTAFDSGYLSRGLAMINSLREVGVQDEVTVLCLDDLCFSYMAEIKLQNVVLLRLGDLEHDVPRLVGVCSERSKGEYIFTCIPSFVRYALEKSRIGDYVVYLDSDVYFYGDPMDGLFGDLRRFRGSIGLTSHQFPRNLMHLRKYGDFNAGCVVFANDDRGSAASAWWAEACLDWCGDYPDDGRYANQGYLNDIAGQFEGAVVLPATGLNVAPWNVSGKTIFQTETGYFLDDGKPLVFFHFHGLQRRGAWMHTGLRAFHVSANSAALQGLYASYILLLEEIAMGATSINRGFPVPATGALVGTRHSRGLRTVLRRVRTRYVQGIERLRGEALRVPTVAPTVDSERFSN